MDKRAKPVESAPPATVKASTLAAMPGAAPSGLGETHTVTINGVAYTWTDATADTVPEEAVAVYDRMVAANA